MLLDDDDGGALFSIKIFELPVGNFLGLFGDPFETFWDSFGTTLRLFGTLLGPLCGTAEAKCCVVVPGVLNRSGAEFPGGL